jgi:hypothetical protein
MILHETERPHPNWRQELAPLADPIGMKTIEVIIQMPAKNFGEGQRPVSHRNQ